MRLPLHVAIIGAGPAGYYTAEALTKGRDDVYVDIIDRLPTPFGLIRAGVAPDHQSIKNVSRRYEQTALSDHVRFVGNISLGADITITELRALYDAVVLAVGAGRDRPLGVEGEDLAGVIGSNAFVSWYNSHPDYTNLDPDLNIKAATVIGNGNVAVDVARILAKTPVEMETSDLARHAAEIIHASPIEDIYIIGRRGPIEASFTPKELGELNKLERCVALVNPDHLPDPSGDDALDGRVRKNLVHLRAMADNRPTDKPVRLHLKFYSRPMAILGKGKVIAIRLEHTRVDADGRCVGTGETEEIKTGLVVPCIGYLSSPIPDVPFDEDWGRFKNDHGLIDTGLYCVGWARRGPTGTIGTNKPDGAEIAGRILDEVKPAGKPGRTGLEKIIKNHNLHIVTFQDWKKIEQAEIEAASGGAPREKFAHVHHMLDAAKD